MKLKTSYVPGIDGLRAIAVLSVILFHLNASFLPGGFSGVDVFFVISGYVVSTSLARETQTSFFKFVGNFYARRIVRIYPALVVCIVLVGFLQTLIMPSSWLSTTSNKTALSAFFGLSNFALILYNDGYFSPRVEFNAFTHTWSLAVEEQFYLLFPVVFFVWLKWRERKDAIGVFSNAILAILLTVSLFLSWHETSTTPANAFYLLPSRFWELACGAVLYKLHNIKKCIPRSSTGVSGCVSTGLILIGLGFVFSDQNFFPFPWAALSVSGALFVIAGVASGSSKDSVVSRILDNRLTVYIGKVSYSLYLWHWPVLVIFRWTVGLEAPPEMLSALAITLAMSLTSYHLIEKPIRQSKFVVLRPDWQVITSGLAMIVICCAFTGLVFWKQPYLSLSVTKDKRNWYPESWSSEDNKTSAETKKLYGLKLYVWGDSHVGAYSTMLRELADKQGVDVHTFHKGGCSIADLLRPVNQECFEHYKNTLSEIKKLAAPGDIVFLASLRMNRFGDQWQSYDASDVVAKQLSAEASVQRSMALQEADTLITELEKRSLTVVMDAPKPIFKSPPFRCSDWFNSKNPICNGGLAIERQFLLDHRRQVMESLDFLKRKHPHLIVWDTFPVLCPSDICHAFDDRKPLFFDGDHLSAHGNRVLYPSFVAMLTSVQWVDGGTSRLVKGSPVFPSSQP